MNPEVQSVQPVRVVVMCANNECNNEVPTIGFKVYDKWFCSPACCSVFRDREEAKCPKPKQYAFSRPDAYGCI